jgi:DNA-binding transcriptional LysR family regulator
MRDDTNGALRAFQTIARHGSFTRAAAELEVTASALSQTMRQLEQRLGVRLLQRTTRKVGLTEAGQAFLARIAPALASIDIAIDALRQHGDRPAGTLRLTTSQVMVPALIEPLLADFLCAYPDIRLDIRVDSALNDLVAEGLDAGIRLGERLQRDMVAMPLGGPQRSVIVGSPAYFRAHGKPTHPRELASHACIRQRFTPGGAPYRWEFCSRGRWFETDVDGPLITNDSPLTVRAALDGVGLLHTMESYVREHVAAGRLECMLESWLPPYDGFHIYYPSRYQVPPKLRAFIDFLRTRLTAPRDQPARARRSTTSRWRVAMRSSSRWRKSRTTVSPATTTSRTRFALPANTNVSIAFVVSRPASNGAVSSSTTKSARAPASSAPVPPPAACAPPASARRSSVSPVCGEARDPLTLRCRVTRR